MDGDPQESIKGQKNGFFLIKVSALVFLSSRDDNRFIGDHAPVLEEAKVGKNALLAGVSDHLSCR